ncbi:MAG: 23S rRNA (pseudouridine(1915)-N(3))-methyltransferase RlmH, partial [Desulfobulbaceae bacterium]|nr:23S rRNA (pseudouridine(1915)-N(3))-methyltransferase RlmH [Desulfobulbaceae bacterium]
MHFELLFLGKTKEKYLANGIEDFRKRLSRYAEVEIKTLKEIKWGNNESEKKIKEQETTRLLDSCTQPAMVVALDPGGKQISSEELADL